MKITPLRWAVQNQWSQSLEAVSHPVDLILYFGATSLLASQTNPVLELRRAFPKALCVGCSSAGEILDRSVADEGISALVIQLESSEVRAERVHVANADMSRAAGEELARRLSGPTLSQILVFSDGLSVNGTQLTQGLRAALPPGVNASGGLAGDGPRFAKTLVGLGDEFQSGVVVGVGFYGRNLRVSHGSAGGWQAFGPTRLITRSEGNRLYELDGQPALQLYKKYLGDLAEGLPATGLLFPLELLAERTSNKGVVRTILAVDESTNSLTFAGDMPTGGYARLMKAGCDSLVSGAEDAAGQAEGNSGNDRLALLVSCVGRKLVMKQRVEEEVDAVLEKLGAGVHAVGFYSYGEICPSGLVHGCDFHNQTMTLTVISEETAASA